MTIFEFWERFSIGNLSPAFQKEALMILTIFGGIIVFAEVIIGMFINFTEHKESPSKILFTMYGPVYVLALLLLDSVEFFLMIQMSFSVIAMSIFIVPMFLLFILKISTAFEDRKSLFGATSFIQNKAIEWVVIPETTISLNGLVQRLIASHNIAKSQNKYLRNYGNK